MQLILKDMKHETCSSNNSTGRTSGPTSSTAAAIITSGAELAKIHLSVGIVDDDKFLLVPADVSSSSSVISTSESGLGSSPSVDNQTGQLSSSSSTTSGVINEAYQSEIEDEDFHPNNVQQPKIQSPMPILINDDDNNNNKKDDEKNNGYSSMITIQNGDGYHHKKSISSIGFDNLGGGGNSSKDVVDLEKNQSKPTTELYQVQTAWSVLRQMSIPFLLAGIGSVFAGVVLNAVTKWSVFINIPQLSIMVSAFLGLIGNIETTLASRLSTQANLGRMDTWSGIRDIVFGNFMVIQCQSSTVGLFAALCSLAISAIREETRSKLSLDSVILLCSTSVCTSIISNTLIAAMIIIVVLGARRLRINPDNISTPVAASMGDVCTISILARVSQWLYDLPDGRFYQIALMVFCLALAPIFGYFARQSRWTRSVIYTGWTAILGAVIIEQPGGVVMESAFHQYKVMSTFQPLVNGIGSNLVGIQTSRMSTFLHASASKGQLPASHPNFCVSPWFVFLSDDLHARMARLLMMVIIPAHLFYMAIIYLLQETFEFSVILTGPFITVYLMAVLIQLILLLYLAYFSVFGAWKFRINPDNSAIPFTSALADVFGNCLMAIAFTFLKAINDANTGLLESENGDGDLFSLNSTSTLGPSYVLYSVTSDWMTTNSTTTKLISTALK